MRSSTWQNMPTEQELHQLEPDFLQATLMQESDPINIGDLIADANTRMQRPMTSHEGPDYQLRRTLLARNKRSTSEAKKLVTRPTESVLTASPLYTQAATEEEYYNGPFSANDLIVSENRSLKNQISQLQNVIVSMCVLNQNQQSVRTSSTSLNHSRSRSGQGISGTHMPTASADMRPTYSNSVQKAIEPHPESLLIEPIERPALLTTVPTDWQHPQFCHSTTNARDVYSHELPSRHRRSFSYKTLNRSLEHPFDHSVSVL